MGCKSSSQNGGASSASSASGSNNGSFRDGSSTSSSVFGSGVHVGRGGNVDLSGRDLDMLGPQLIYSIKNDGMDRAATTLTLSDNKLYSLGKEVAVLSELRELKLDRNRFQRFPEVLAQLPRLSRISACCNPLEGSRGLDVLPRLVSLRSLLLKDCNLKEVPLAILQCSLLEELDVGNNPEMKLTGAPLHRLPGLKKLGISHCGLSGRSLPGAVKRMKLVALDISGNAYNFADPEFFGKVLPRTLNDLYLCSMNLTSVPAAVATLRHLSLLDLAENPIETLDVLAGRVVKRIPRVGSNGTVNATALSEMPDEVDGGEKDDGEAEEETATVLSDGNGSTTTGRLSLSRLSKAGIVAHVSQPMALKRLSLRGCNFRTVPKYFHKLTQLESLNLSENVNLDDPNMTLFSLQNLVSLNITGCPFAEDPTQSRNEWFDIGKLHHLRCIQWEIWKSTNNMSSYRTRIPIELCALPLKMLNEVSLRSNLFTGDMVETVVNLLSDGYFKVDLSIDELILHSHIAAVKSFIASEVFFAPKNLTVAGDVKSGLIKPEALGAVHLQIAISRYIFFLAMQAANYDAVIIPPLDVMILHYSQMTMAPLAYRTDCEAVCGRILNCNYRTFFAEQKNHLKEAKEAVAASRRIWNLMVKSAQRNLGWLRYDYWEKRGRQALGPETSAAVQASRSYEDTHAIPKALPLLCGTTTAEVEADWQQLQATDSAYDLSSVLDLAITSHFDETGTERFAQALHDFFGMSRCFIANEASFRKIELDWTRYVKYLTLFAYRAAVTSNEPYRDPGSTDAVLNGDDDLFSAIGAEKKTSILGKRYDSLINTSFSGSSKYLPQPAPQKGKSSNGNGVGDEATGVSAVRRSDESLLKKSTSTLVRAKRSNRRLMAIRAMTTNPVPTLGLTFLLHAHRTSHIKYFQMLSLFALETRDITWDVTAPTAVDETKAGWEALYNEAYIVDRGNASFTYSTADGILMPVPCSSTASDRPPAADPAATTAAGEAVTATRTTALDKARFFVRHSYDYDATAKPKRSCIPARSVKKTKSAGSSVVFCSGDVEFGIF